MRSMLLAPLFAAMLNLGLARTAVSQIKPDQSARPAAGEKIRIKADVWADNWFAFYLDDRLVKEDSVPITTERSFNAETFTFVASYPLAFNFVAKDFKENDTGLEYIGTRRQQVGDGGLIAQFRNADTGELIAVTNSSWSCFVTHDAPSDAACARETQPVAGRGPCGFTVVNEPSGWKEQTFDDTKWPKATLFSAREVGPKGGYDEIVWESQAKFIWGPDLKTNNTVLCRIVVAGPVGK